MKKYFYMVVLPCLILSGILLSTTALDKRTTPKWKNEKLQGFSWEASDSIATQHIQTLNPHSVNWIAQTPFGWQADIHQPELVYRSSRGYWGERDAGLINTALVAREAGVETMLKPHIWLRRSAGGWRSDIDMQSEEDWQTWFDNYEAFILHYAKLAEEQSIPVLCIGTELYLCATKREQDWRDLIVKIRATYSGQITYAANFYKEYEEIQFWDALDFIGIQGYFPLTKKDHPSLKELKEGWEPHHKKIKKLSKRWNKPVLFTEFGYRSMKDAAIEPWVWPNDIEFTDTDVSPETQALCYEAFFQTFWKEDWLAGVFLWKWSRRNYKPEAYYQGLDRPGRNGQKRKDLSPIDFSPKEEGLKVIGEWFGKP